MLDSGANTFYDLISYTSARCPTSQLCGQSVYYDDENQFSVSSMPKSSMCVWYIDLRNTSDTTLNIKLNFNAENIGTLIIDSSFYQKTGPSTTVSITYYINTGNYQSFSTISMQQKNYFVLTYYTSNNQNFYSGFSLSWETNSSSSSGSLSKILTIAALCLVSVFCMGCCGVLCRRLYKSSRNSNRVYDMAIANYQNRSRAYEELPDNSVLSEDDIERFFPRQVYKENLWEIGEKLCCIWAE